MQTIKNAPVMEKTHQPVCHCRNACGLRQFAKI